VIKQIDLDHPYAINPHDSPHRDHATTTNSSYCSTVATLKIPTEVGLENHSDEVSELSSSRVTGRYFDGIGWRESHDEESSLFTRTEI